ncbi:uncharacterized protein [Montipora foliosa]|uniref:uncharacterized protein isoform X1 n=1 Tax=Montipora foliosa TaxID=591990 RepID=UPI0035F18DCE
MADSRTSLYELDFPEILSKERLIEILCQRCMQLQDLMDLEKSDLVELFHKYVTPLPQRLHQLRRAKRMIPCGGKQRGTSQGKNTITRLLKRKSEETSDASNCKIARTVPSSSSKMSKKTLSLEFINKEIDSVSINSASSPTQDSSSGHNHNVMSKITKAKVVKLNRKTLGLNLNTSVSQCALKDKLASTLNGKTQQEINSSTNDSCSSDKDIQINTPKKKFEKIAVTWP